MNITRTILAVNIPQQRLAVIATSGDRYLSAFPANMAGLALNAAR